MRKILSFLMMTLFSVSMFAAEPAAAGTTLFSEDFSSYSKDDVPSGTVTTATGRVVYGNANVTYTCTDGGSTTKIYNENTGGGTAPEILVSKSQGSFAVAGIPSGGAKAITVSFTQNKQALSVEPSGTGYTGSISGKPGAVGTRTFDITVADGADATFTLTFTGSGSSNVRVDDILVTVKTAGEGGGEATHTYTVAGSSADAFGTAWDPSNTANDMVKQDNGTYKWEKTNLTLPSGSLEFKVCEDHDWEVAYPAQNYSLSIAEAGIYTITITFDPAAESDKVAAQASKTGSAEVDPTAAIKGGWDSWANELALVLAGDKLTATGVLNIAAAGDYEFKVILNGSDWRSNGYTYHRDFTGAEGITSNGDNMKLQADVAGEYTFTWTFATNALAITFPEQSIEVELQAISEATTWDFSKITANKDNSLYSSDGIKLTAESTPNKNEEVVYANYSADFMTFAEGFDATAMAFKGEYPIRKNKYCQNGTLRFKTTVAGSIVVKFSDTGTSASATAVKRYLIVNGEQTEYWTSRENNGEDAYDAQLDVTTGAIAVAAGEVTITGSSAIVVYSVEFAPASAPEPAAKFYITGNAALVGDELEWNPAAIKSMEDSYKLNLKAGVDYMLKLTLNGTWEGENNVKGYDALTTVADGLIRGTGSDDDNICFKLNADGEVNVHYDGEFFFLNGDFYVAPVVTKYFLKNNWDGAETWTWKEMTNDNGSYILAEVVFGGTGVNINTAESDEGASWIEAEDIETFDLSYEPATLGALDTVVFFFDPEAVNTYMGVSGLSAQILGKYVAPVPQPELADGFYLIGKIGGVEGWNVADLKAEQKFAPNLENPVEFMLDVTLAEGDELKVVNVLNNEITAWFPGGENSNFNVTAAYAGEKTVYFRPDQQGGEGWHYGCIYIAPNPGTGISNTAVDGKAVKMIMDGQFLIIRNGKTYNVQGQQLK